ncbi:MAG TPA: hypothetical protein VJZ00_09580 [Thermoanaerobaculia bacterium]|nr:hypothetical protein [Thermoanaerobaculia bacterium]
MRRVAVALLLLVSFALSCASQRERLLPPKGVLVRHPFPDELTTDVGERYAPPRDDMASDPARRRDALRELEAMRNGNAFPPPAPKPGPGPQPMGEHPCGWEFIGPTNIHGRVLDIAIDPNNRKRIFLATVGGVWRSLDAARRWERVSDDIFAGVFSAVAINRTTPAEVFAAGGDANMIAQPVPNGVGIWRSTLGGDAGTWSKTSVAEIDDSLVYRIRVDEKPPNHVYAATSTGLWRGVHSGGGITWSRLGGFDAWTTDVVLDSSGPATLVYAAVQEPSPTRTRGVWKWDGTQWLDKTGIIDTSQSNVIRLAIAKTDSGILFARVEGPQGSLVGIYKTINHADDWEKKDAATVEVSANAPNGQCAAGYMAPMEIDPTNAKTIYAGCLFIFRSTDGGTHFDNVNSGADGSYPYYVHFDQHAIAFDPVNSHLVYIGHDGGLDRSTDTSIAPWHWTDVSHGMSTWQVYEAAGQANISTLLAAGAQDTGNAITFGNRAWNHSGNCDGNGIAADAGNATTFYVSCAGGTLQVATNEMRGTAGFPSWATTTPAAVYPPVSVDRDLSRHLLVASHPGCNAALQLLRSTDALNYTPVVNVPAGLFLQRVHVARNSAFKRYYVGFESCALPDEPQLWSTPDGGMTWVKALANALPKSRVFAIDADPANGARAFAAFGTSIVMTKDGGTTWVPIDGSGATALPPSAMRRDVAIDPSDPNVIYAATDVGVFKGVVSGANASWTPFDEGLPIGVDVRALDVDTKAKSLRIGTWGYGFFRRDITGAACPDRALIVRDNVFDRGLSPSTPPGGYLDPEHPIPDPANPPFYKAEDSPAGRLYWWSSSDVRIDVPLVDPHANQIGIADHVELETCPLLGVQCPSGTLLDSHPRRGKFARAYVQATNRGSEPVTNARVIALWTDTTVSTPQLPPDFWTKTFPPPGTPCGALAPNSPWHLIDPAKPCRTLAKIEPVMPEVAEFDWNVPGNAPERACFLTIVESADDPLPPAIRATNQLNLWNLVPQNRHMTVRNLHIVDPIAPPAPGPKMFAEIVTLPNPTPEEGLELLADVANVRVFLPHAVEGLRGRTPTPEERRFAAKQKLDASAVYDMPPDAPLRLPVRAGETWRIAIVAPHVEGTRLSVITMQHGVVLGGSTFLFRQRIPRLTGALH